MSIAINKTNNIRVKKQEPRNTAQRLSVMNIKLNRPWFSPGKQCCREWTKNETHLTRSQKQVFFFALHFYTQ